MTSSEINVSVGKVVYTFSDGTVVMQYQGKEIETASNETNSEVYNKIYSGAYVKCRLQFYKFEHGNEFAYQLLYTNAICPTAKCSPIYLGKYKT